MRVILSTLILSFFLTVGTQAKTISGLITDKSDGKPLSGVNITNSSTKDAVLSDRAGRYSIEAEQGEELVFTYVGYHEVRVLVGANTTENVVMEIADVAIADTRSNPRKRETFTGSVAVDRPVAEAAISVHGKAAGQTQMSYVAPGVRNLVIRPSYPSMNSTETYATITENTFANPLQEPLSTFAADVDAASYSNVKRFIKSGSLPPEDAVRIEEMINYFDYEFAKPRRNNPVGIMTELTNAPWNSQHQLLRISLKARDIPTDKLPPSNFVFLIDISGSMSSPNKLPLVKSSFRMLVDQLRPQDKVAIVTYAGNANIALESTTGDNKMKIKEVIDGLQAGGSTAGGDGLRMAYRIARQNFVKNGNNRVIMATDGDFNVGAASDADMEKLIVRERESDVNISVLGYGMGNYKDSKLELLANKGRGNHAYINDISEARKAIITEFGGTMYTVAKDVKIQVEFNPKYVQAYRLIGYENRLMAAEDFNNDAKVGGDMGVGHAVTALYEIVPTGVRSTIIGSVDPLKYQESQKKVIKNNSTELATVKFRYKEPNSDKSKMQEHVVASRPIALSQASADLRFMTAVAELGMLLRNSAFKQQSDFDQLIQRARNAKGTDHEGYRAEFIRLAEDAKVLTKSEGLAAR